MRSILRASLASLVLLALVAAPRAQTLPQGQPGMMQGQADAMGAMQMLEPGAVHEDANFRVLIPEQFMGMKMSGMVTASQTESAYSTPIAFIVIDTPGDPEMPPIEEIDPDSEEFLRHMGMAMKQVGEAGEVQADIEKVEWRGQLWLTGEVDAESPDGDVHSRFWMTQHKGQQIVLAYNGPREAIQAMDRFIEEHRKSFELID